MTKKQKERKLEDIHNWAIANGWEEDRWGNYKKTTADGEYRIKIQKTSIRYEVKYDKVGDGSPWARIRSGYIKDINITEDGRIIGWAAK